MADYEQWNIAIASHFLQGLPIGSEVYLSLDSEALFEISSKISVIENSDEPWVEDFCLAIREECVNDGQVQMPSANLNEFDLPVGVAFIGAMVFAAYLMMGEETDEGMISETNYFKRFREVLGLDTEEQGRPLGLKPPGIEECLWQKWNEYLLAKGFLPSAEAGQGITQKYINYPLSQALLRKADRERMEYIFRKEEQTGNMSRSLDFERLNIWLKNNVHLFTTSHLRDLLQQEDKRRQIAFYEAIYDVYTQIDWVEQQICSDFRSGFERLKRLTAGLYRIEDPFSGKIEYWLYPQEPRRYQAIGLSINKDGQQYYLELERPGWYIPLWPVNPAGGVTYKVSGDSRIHEMVLPEKGFWVLIRDPENTDNGILASWGYPELGETFLLLCRKEYKEQVELFVQENLLKYDHSVECSEPLDGWIEYRECMVVSENWDCIISASSDLIEALKPNIRASISLKNGLKLPPQLQWLEGYGPDMTIIGFTDSVNLYLYELSAPSKYIKNEMIKTNQLISLNDLSPGYYVIKILEGNKLIATKSFRIKAWNDLESKMVDTFMGYDLGSNILDGVIIRSNE